MMPKNIPAFMARTQFGQIVERVSKDNERFVVTKKGAATAVILGVDDFLATMADTPESIRVLQRQAGSSGSSNLTLEQIEEEIAVVRNARPKRV